MIGSFKIFTIEFNKAEAFTPKTKLMRLGEGGVPFGRFPEFRTNVDGIKNKNAQPTDDDRKQRFSTIALHYLLVRNTKQTKPIFV